MVGASPQAPHLFSQEFRGSILPISLFTPKSRGILPPYVFVMIQIDKGCEKALSTIKLFQIQEIIIITRVHCGSEAGLVAYEENPPSVHLVPETCSRLGAEERPHSVPRIPGCSRLPRQHFTRPWPSRFPAELGCSLNFQCWFDFL